MEMSRWTYESFLATAGISSPTATFKLFMNSQQPHPKKVASSSPRILQLNIDTFLSLLAMLFMCQILPGCMYVDTVVLLWHVVANILRANGKTTGALWRPNGFDG